MEGVVKVCLLQAALLQGMSAGRQWHTIRHAILSPRIPLYHTQLNLCLVENSGQFTFLAFFSPSALVVDVHL